MSRRLRFRNRDDRESQALREWHADLVQQYRRGDRARLRRARTIEDAALEPAFHRLLRRLGLSPAGDGEERRAEPADLSALAAVAAVAAMAGRDAELALGTHLGRPKPGSSAAPVSEARFRRLLAAGELEHRFDVLRRILPLLGGGSDAAADLVELAGVLCDWTAWRRRQLAYDYYAVAPQQKEIA